MPERSTIHTQMSTDRKLRVGIVDYLNAWPLAWGFLTGALESTWDAVYLPPARLTEELGSGRLDIGLIPSIEVQRLPGLMVVPGLCVAANHEVQSVILLSRGSIESIRRVAVDRNSRTSAALVQILLRDRWGVDAQVEEASPDAEEMLARADAALIIGDPALRLDRERYRVWDLAVEWRALTEKPFVFAVWAARRGVSRRASEIRDTLRASLELGLAELDQVVGRATRELGLEPVAARHYLTRSLSYRLDGEALAGLHEFYRRAAHHGLIERQKPIDYVEESELSSA